MHKLELLLVKMLIDIKHTQAEREVMTSVVIAVNELVQLANSWLAEVELVVTVAEQPGITRRVHEHVGFEEMNIPLAEV
jgi:hypothetical protein